MKSAILTLDGHLNYGNRLQNYALQKCLSNFGDCSTLWWNGPYELFAKRKFTIKEKIKILLNYHNFENKVVQYDLYNAIKQYNIKEFSDKYLKVEKADFNRIDDSPLIFDKYFVGSDQVWNPCGWGKNSYIDKVMFLKFCPSNKRFAYAASISSNFIPKKIEKRFILGLEGFNKISVREQSAAELIKKISGKDVPVVLDPTMLLNKNDWTSLERKPDWYEGENYVLTYFLGKPNESIVKYAKENNFKIFNLMDPHNINLYVSKVEEFIYLIHHCQFMCTDSFHGTVFSILFERPFVVFNRRDLILNDMSSRLTSLLNTLKLSNQYYDLTSSNINFSSLFDIDYSEVNKILNSERIKSIEFLKSCFAISN